MRFSPTLLWLLAVLALAGAPGPARALGPCGAPEEALQIGPLPATAAALAAGQLSILVVGSASVNAPAASGPDQAYPIRLQELLARRHPAVVVEVVALGARGMMAADHLALLRTALARRPRALVLWQAGTVEAVRGADIGDLTDAIATAAGLVQASRTDLVLIDPQWSRFLRANADVESYRDALRAGAAAGNAGLFSRYALMQAWAEAETVDVERAPRERRAGEVDRLNNCLAESLAEAIARGVAEVRR